MILKNDVTYGFKTHLVILPIITHYIFPNTYLFELVILPVNIYSFFYFLSTYGDNIYQ